MSPLPVILLAQLDADVFVWSAILIVIVIALFGVVVWVRRRLSPDEEFHGEGFTLGDLRRLHQAGKLTAEEFERAKAQIIASAQATQRKESPSNDLRDAG